MACPLPRDVDARTREETLSLTEMRRAIPSDCMAPSDARSLLSLVRVLATIALFAYLASMIHAETPLTWALLAAATVGQGFAMVGLFVLGHDCGHHSFSRRRWINEVVGHLAMSPLVTSLRSWQLYHDHHHRWPQKHGVQVDFYRYLATRKELSLRSSGSRATITRLGYRVPGGLLFWILGGIYRRATLARSIPELVRNERAARRLRVSALSTLAGAVAIWTTIGLWAGPLAIVKYHLAPLLVATLTGSLIFVVQHTNMEALFYAPEAWTPLRGQVVSTFDVRFPRLLEWMWCDINFHIAHHVAPRIPWYHLRRAARALARAYPRYYQERRFGASELRFMWRVPLLRPVPEMGYFLMEPLAPNEPGGASPK
jgi:omega-6 fatty acid desaturase (delta-12 desaturase)